MRKWIIGFLFLIAIIIIVAYHAEVQEFIELLNQVKPLWFCLVFLFQVGTYVSHAAVWQFALQWVDEKSSFPHLIFLSLSELFVNQTLPSSGLSGTATVTQFLLRRNISAHAVALAVALNVVGRQIAYLIAFIGAVMILWVYHPLSKALIYLAVIFTLMMVVILVGAAYLWTLTSHTATTPRILLRFRSIDALLSAIKELQPNLLLNVRIMVPAVILLLGVFIFDALTLWAILQALGIDLNFGLIFAAQVVSSAVATLSFMPGGLGVFEGSLTGILHLLGLSIESAFAATILFRGFTYWLPMLPGFLVTQREARKK